MSLELLSSAFAAGGRLPVKYTCDGENVSPPLVWRGTPAGAESMVLICDDPNGPNGLLSHWVLYNLPVQPDQLPEAIGEDERPGGGMQGRNDFGTIKYEGPCPPAGGEEHTYFFRLYALDTSLDLSSGATRAQAMDRMQDHILDRTEMMVSYGPR